jgi:DNA-binding transcriptional ArsR family regulator
VAKITLDTKTFQALASATRLTVLRALDERRKTLTELARDLELNKATVHEHLQLLVAAGLVRKRDDEGRKWIYYELTWTGEKLLHPQETTTFSVLLGLGVAAAGGGVLMLGRALGWWLATMPMEAATKQDVDVAGATAFADAPEARLSESPVETDFGDGWLGIVLMGASIAFTALAVFLRRHIRPGRNLPAQPEPDSESA